MRSSPRHFQKALPMFSKPKCVLLPLFLVCSVVFLGCTNEMLTIPVAGKITYGGGAWPKPARATFACEEAAPGFEVHPADVELKTDGSFQVSLVPGKYVVNLECWEVEPTMENPAAAVSYLPLTHSSGAQGGIRFEVKPTDSKVEFNFDVPKRD